MATRKEWIYAVKEILSGLNITDESRLDDDVIGFFIDTKRASQIRETFKRNPVIEPVWLQDYGVFQLTKVNKAEDRTISFCTCETAKATLPPVVSLTDNMSNLSNLGRFSIRSVCNTYEFNYINTQKLSLVTDESTYGLFKYFTEIGNSVYLLPNVEKARGIFIFAHPLDAFVLDNTYKLSGELVTGTSYEVASGSVTHNSTIYSKGSTFTAASSTFTGSGKVWLSTQKRATTNDDEYPMSADMGEKVVVRVLTEDFGIEQRIIDDFKNNSKDDQKG